jgi:predicted metallopeptidase
MPDNQTDNQLNEDQENIQEENTMIEPESGPTEDTAGDIPFSNTPTPVTKILVIPDWYGQYVIRDQFRPIADALVKKYEELKHIQTNSILFVSNTTGKGADKDRHKLAQIATIPAKWTEILYQFTGGNFTYLMEFFAANIHHLKREQYIALIYHELRHIGHDGKLVHHDIEDWSRMISALGIDWSGCKDEGDFPDLLDEDLDWDRLIGQQKRQMNLEDARSTYARLHDQIEGLLPDGVDSMTISTGDGVPGQRLTLVR